MANSEEHAAMGALAGLGFYWLWTRLKEVEFDWGKALVCAGIGSFFGVLPDILDPPNSPRHRQAAHSLLLFVGAIIAEIHVLHRQDMPEELRLFLSSLLVGYSSHLLLDATTPAGLPVA